MLLRFIRLLIIASAASLTSAVNAQPTAAVPFEVSASPSRFVLSADAGERMVRSFSLKNVGRQPITVRIRTLDWTLGEVGGPAYQEPLVPGSCRPWVAIERRELTIAAGEDRAFRFQIDVPVGTAPGECRFMVVIQGAAPAAIRRQETEGRNIAMPISARLAAPVYVATGGARPKLAAVRTSVQSIEGTMRPVIVVRNDGKAHGRLDGTADAVDAKGTQFQIAPESTPILPGQSRVLALSAQAPRGQKPHAFVLPITVKGSFDSDSGAIPIDARFE